MNGKSLDMRNHCLAAAIAAALALSGCAGIPERLQVAAATYAAARPLVPEPVRYWADGPLEQYGDWLLLLEQQRIASPGDGAGSLLAISSGSDDGAFAAGLLNGWSARGDRPEFAIVTGVSTGALIAPLAFLGPAYDDQLRRLYTTIQRSDIFAPSLARGLLGGASLLDTTPLAGLIARNVSASMLDEIAAEHRRGRRLLVLTTNLDAQRGVVWDMGAIATSSSPNRLALFRQVLLASSSIPGAFTPVLIDVETGAERFSEMHVDGGTVAGFMTLPRALLDVMGEMDPSPERRIVVIYNGHLEPRFELVKPKTLTILGRALATTLTEADRAAIDALRDFANAKRTGFAVCSIQSDFAEVSTSMFERKYMNALYDYGARIARTPTGCLSR